MLIALVRTRVIRRSRHLDTGVCVCCVQSCGQPRVNVSKADQHRLAAVSFSRRDDRTTIGREWSVQWGCSSKSISIYACTIFRIDADTNPIIGAVAVLLYSLRRSATPRKCMRPSRRIGDHFDRHTNYHYSTLNQLLIGMRADAVFRKWRALGNRVSKSQHVLAQFKGCARLSNVVREQPTISISLTTFYFRFHWFTTEAFQNISTQNCLQETE